MLPRHLHLAALAALPLFSSAHAVDLTETFDGTEIDAAVWNSVGNKSATVDSGFLTWNADGGPWASGDINTTQAYNLPAGGATTSITWTLGPAEITNPFPDESGQSLRLQIGIHSANETSNRFEHWNNTTGGLWLDLDNIRQTVPDSMSGALRSANDTKVSATQGDEVAQVTLAGWDWETTTREIRLEFDDSEFTWFDGATEIGSGTFAAAGIDTEFDNGFKILALGMNFDGGQGTISIDKIEATGLELPSSPILSFTTSIQDPYANEKFLLEFSAASDVTALSIDNGIGSVLGTTSVEVIAPNVTEPTDLTFTLTATRDGQDDTRELIVPIQPAPAPRLTHLLDHFEGTDLDETTWIHRGNRTFNVADSLVNWPAGSHDWSHGEVNSVEVFPIPEPGKPTTIIWTIGTSEVTVPSTDPARAIRPLIGIASAFERNNYSLQHWQNTAGGIWLDVTQMSDARTTGVAGELYTANDTKTFESNGVEVSTFDVPDWNWETETHEFSLVLTDLGYTWYSGANEVGSSTWELDGLDEELVNGFRILASSINYNVGRGNTSLDAIEVINGTALVPPIIITGFTHDPDTDTTTLTWDSEPDRLYAIDISSDLQSWPGDIEDSLESDGETTSYMHTEAADSILFYRIRDVTDE